MAKKSPSQAPKQEPLPPEPPVPSAEAIINLDEDEVDSLIELAHAADKLPQILAAAVQVGPQVSIAEVARKVSRKVDLPPPRVRLILSAILSLYHTQVNLERDAEATVQIVTQSLDRLLRKDKNQLKIWKDVKEKVLQAIKALNPDHPLEVSSKAYKVASSRPNIVVWMDFSTEARPVFDDAGDKVLLTLISHTLSFEYHKGPGHREIRLSLDVEDLGFLRVLCEEAERQAAILKRDLRQAPWPTSIIHESVDADDESK